MVVETADALLVAARDKVQDVRRIVARLNQAKRPQATAHRLTYRPWGSYDAIDDGDRFQVKRIRVAPVSYTHLQGQQRR